MSAVTDHAPPPPPIPLVPPLHLCRDGCSREILWELNRSPCARTSSTYNRRGIDHFWQRPPVDQWPWPYWQKPSKQNTNEGLLVCLSVHHNCQIYFPKELFIKTFEQRYVSDCSADLLQVLPCCGKRYQQRRLVNNRACIARWAHNAEDICEVHTQMLHQCFDKYWYLWYYNWVLVNKHCQWFLKGECIITLSWKLLVCNNDFLFHQACDNSETVQCWRCRHCCNFCSATWISGDFLSTQHANWRCTNCLSNI